MLTLDYGTIDGSGAPPQARLRLPQTVRVRPSDSHGHDFDEILPTLNTSRESVYFASKNQSYTEGMRVFITYPYSDGPGSLNRESLGKVVRIDDLGMAAAALPSKS